MTSVNPDQTLLPSVAVKKAQTAGLSRGEKVFYSTWLVTVNTNKAPQGNTPAEVRADAKRLAAKVERLTAALWSAESMAAGAVKFLIKGHSFTTDYILKAEAEYAVEIGEVLQRIHSHSLVSIEHRSKIHLDYEYIRRFFIENSDGEFTNIHLDVKFVPGRQNALQYLRKGSTLASLTA